MAAKTTVQSPLQRFWKAVAVFAAMLFLFGGSAGFVQASQQRESVALDLAHDGFSVPGPSVGETVAYGMSFSGNWSTLPNGSKHVEPYAVMKVLGTDSVRYPDGHVQNGLAMVEGRWYLQWVRDNDAEWGLQSEWTWNEMAYVADPTSYRPVAQAVGATGNSSASDGTVTVGGFAEISAVRFFDQEAPVGCLHAVPPAVEPGKLAEWRWEGCTLDGFTFDVDTQDIARIVDPDAADGRLHVRMADEDGNITVDLWYMEEVSRPVEIRFSDHSGDEFLGFTIRMTHYTPGDGLAIDSAWTEPALPPIRRLPWTEPWPDDSDLDHPFPISAAMKQALADPAYQDVNDFLAEYPDAYVSDYRYSKVEDDKEIDRHWWLDLRGSGDAAMAFSAKMKTPAPGSLDETIDPEVLDVAARYEFSTWPFDVEPTAAPSDQRPKDYWSFGDMVRWLDAFSGEVASAENDNEPGFWSIYHCFPPDCEDLLLVSRDNVEWSAVPFVPPSTPLTDEMGRFRVEDSSMMFQGGTPQFLYALGADYEWGIAATKEVPPETLAEAEAVDESMVDGLELSAWIAPAPAAAGVSIGVALLTAVTYYLWPFLKQSMFFGLFSRLKTPSLLDHPARSAIHSVIQETPGARFTDLADRTGLANGTLRHHLSMLCDAGIVLRRETGGFTCYFAPQDATAENLALAGSAQSAGARTVLDFIQGHPGTTARLIADTTGLAVGTVGYHVKRLRDAGVVASERDGRQVRLAVR